MNIKRLAAPKGWREFGKGNWKIFCIFFYEFETEDNFSTIFGIFFYRIISRGDQLLGGKLTGIVIALFAARIWMWPEVLRLAPGALWDTFRTLSGISKGKRPRFRQTCTFFISTIPPDEIETFSASVQKSSRASASSWTDTKRERFRVRIDQGISLSHPVLA